MTILGEGHTLLNLIRYYLTNSDTIEYAGYTMRHPLEARSKVFIKTTDGSARDALITTLQLIRDELEDFKKDFTTAIEKYNKST